MQCPHCAGTTLVMAERQGIEIDYCPKCRGVWLDRGELDKIVERTMAAETAPAQAAPAFSAFPAPQRSAPRQPDFEDSDFRRPSHDSRQGQQPYRKRKSLLSDLFDFD
jgi:Zn-finger nucleic acid-binding protein